MKKPLLVKISISYIETVESWVIGLALGLLALGVGSTLFFFYATQNTFYQGIKIDGIEMGGLTKDEAVTVLRKQQDQLANVPITVSVDTIMVASQSAELGVQKEYSQVVHESFEIGRSGFPPERIWTILKLAFTPQNFTTPYAIQQEKLDQLIAHLAQKVDIQGEAPHADLHLSGIASSLVVHPGKVGRAVDRPVTRQLVEQAIKNQVRLGDTAVAAPVASTAAELSPTEMALAQARAEKLVGTSATFTADQLSLELNDQQLIEMLAFPTGYQLTAATEPTKENATSDVTPSLLEKWQSRINRDPQEPVFEYDRVTLVVSKFVAPKNGLELDKDETRRLLLSTLQAIETQVNQPPSEEGSEDEIEFRFELPVKIKAPKKQLADTNNLGINELVGFGESEYDHSIPSRIHNVALTASKMNLKIIPPGAEFSFNKELGDVSSATGFKPAYVISGGRTVLGDGGGVCQVSTTMFRAVLDAGLLVTKRKAHSYRVSYYELNEKPGVDATVYSGDVDLRFVNDTSGHLLVHSAADSSDLYMFIELYGTSDGRSAEIVNHEVWDYRAPLAPVYIDEPSLPPGSVQQVDWAVSGIKAQFTNRIVDKNGNLIREDEYYSNYVPWSAKYLRGV